MKVKPWMLGLGIVGVGVAGVMAYEAVQSRKTAAAGATFAAQLAAKTGPPPPLINVLRPIPSTGAGTFSSNAPPAGPQLTMAPGAMSTQLTGTSWVTLILPPGASWTTIIIGNSSTHAIFAQVGLNGDTTSAISLSIGQLVGTNMIVAGWKDSAGRAQQTVVSLPLVVAPKPLTFHV